MRRHVSVHSLTLLLSFHLEISRLARCVRDLVCKVWGDQGLGPAKQ